MTVLIPGELEDVRPCDDCGLDYVFVVGEDPGVCPACSRFAAQLSELERATRRERRAIAEQSSANVLLFAADVGLQWICYDRQRSHVPLRWHLVPAGADLEADVIVPSVCRVGLAAHKIVPAGGALPGGSSVCRVCAGLAGEKGIATP